MMSQATQTLSSKLTRLAWAGFFAFSSFWDFFWLPWFLNNGPKARKLLGFLELVFLTTSLHEVATTTRGEGDKTVDAEGLILVQAPSSMTADLPFRLFGETTKPRTRKSAQR